MLDTDKICHVCQRSRHLSLRATVGPDGDTLIAVEPCRHNRGDAELEFSETTIADAGDRDAEWHRAEFRRQLADPAHVEKLKREREAAQRRNRAALDAWPDI